MKQFLSLVLVLILAGTLSSQIVSPYEDSKSIQDSLQELSKREIPSDSLKIHKPVISDYTYWRENDLMPIQIDTALTIEGLYRQNFTQKDVFGKMYFPNFGQTFNPLEFEKRKFRLELLPHGKSFNYLYPEDINYYDVKTPMTEFIFENGLREGQYLSTTFAHNLSPQFNYSLRYRGLRSVGRYQNSLAANNAFIASVNYKSLNQRIKFWSHFASQNIDNNENAGIRDLNQFENDKELRTTNRQNIIVNLKSAYTEFDSRRFHLGASYRLLGKEVSDSTQSSTPLIFKNVFSYEKQKFFYKENQNEEYYPSSVFTNYERRNLKSFETLQNTSTVEFKWNENLLIEAGLRYENLKLYAVEELSQGLIFIPGAVEDNLLGGIGRFYFNWNDKINITANAEFKSGELFKNQFQVKTEADFQPLVGYHVVAGASLESTFPSLNLFYNQSFYKDFNYYNYSFKNSNTQSLYGKLVADRFNSDVEARVYNIENHVFVGTDFRPQQLPTHISLFQLKLNNLLSYQRFHLRTTLEYQKVTQNEEYLPLPELIARASLYWQGKVFDNKAEVQIGFNANYFSEFESREFFPIINEFMLQRTHPEFGIQKIGGFPMLDFFANIKVQRMQIFLRADHFNTFWGKNNYYSAPSTPFRDFKIQIGIKWYLFT